MTSALDLSAYPAVEHAYFIRIETTESGLPVILRLSTHRVSIEITESDAIAYAYTGVGSILDVSQIVSDSKTTLADVTITLAGIPNTYVSEVLNTQIKSSPVEIRRAYFDPHTGQLLAIPGNPSLSFSGFVTNFAFDEGWSDGSNQSVTTALQMVCSSTVSVLQNKVAGRRTCHSDQTYWFPGDNSMSRVALLPDVFFDFGGTTPTAKPAPTQGVTVTK